MVYLSILALCLLYNHFQYTPTLRERWLWLVAPALGLAMHFIWGWWCRSMTTERQIFLNGFWYWQVFAVAIPSTIMPPILYGVRLTPMAWTGITLVLVGTTLVYFGKSG